MANIVILLELHLKFLKAPSLPLCYFCIISLIYQAISVKLLGYNYADDVLLYTSIKSEDCLKLQKDLHMLEIWAATWKMSFNVN